MAEYQIPPWLAQTPDYGAMAQRTSIARANMQQQAQEMAMRQAMQQQELAQKTQLAQMEIQQQQQRLQEQNAQFHAKLAQDQQQLQVQTEVRQQQLAQQAELASHRMEIQKAYNDAQVGLHAGQLEVAQQGLQLKYGEALQKWQASQQAQENIQRLIKEKNYTPKQAFDETVFTAGPGQFSASAYTAAKATSAQDKEAKGTVITLPSGRKVEAITMGGQLRIMPPVGATEPGATKESHGLLKLVDEKGHIRYIKEPTFKFSGADELKEMRKSPYFKYASGAEQPDRSMQKRKDVMDKIDTMRKRYAELIRDMEEESAAFEGVNPASAPGTNTPVIMPPPGLTNAPPPMTNSATFGNPNVSTNTATTNRYRWDPKASRLTPR